MVNGTKLTILMLLVLLGLVLTPFSVWASSSGSGRAIFLPESAESKLPSGCLLIRRTQDIYQTHELKISAPIKHMMKQVFDFLGQLLKKISRFLLKHPPSRPAAINWIKILKALSLPVIILTIAYVLYHFGSRLKRDIHETQTTVHTLNASWQGLIQNALRTKELSPLEALHDLVQAVIRRYVNQGQLPDDPTLTVREIGNYLKKRTLTNDQLASFDTLRLIYETVYYGGRPITPNDWDRIFASVNVIVGEAIV